MLIWRNLYDSLFVLSAGSLIRSVDSFIFFAQKPALGPQEEEPKLEPEAGVA